MAVSTLDVTRWSPRDVLPPREELLELGLLNLAEFVRLTARHGGTVLEEDGLLLFAGAHPYPGPYRNGIMRLARRLDAMEVRRRADEFFGRLRRGYILWTCQDHDGDLISSCQADSLQLLEPEGLPELALIVEPEEVTVPDGVRVEWAIDEKTRWDFLRVNAAAWGMPGMSDELAAAMFFHPDSLDAPNVIAAIAYVGDEPVSTAMALMSHGVGGGYWGATVPGASRQGLARLCVRFVRQAGTNMGPKIGVIQASGVGERVWQRLGWDPFTRFFRFVVPPPSNGIPSGLKWE